MQQLSKMRFAPDLLEGKVCLVTGGGTGMGRATAIEMARCGARIVVLGRRTAPIEDTAKIIREIGGNAIAISADIRMPNQIENAMLRIKDEFGQLDILVNNAGGQFVTPARELNNKGFETVIRNNSDRLLADDQGRRRSLHAGARRIDRVRDRLRPLRPERFRAYGRGARRRAGDDEDAGFRVGGIRHSPQLRCSRHHQDRRHGPLPDRTRAMAEAQPQCARTYGRRRGYFGRDHIPQFAAGEIRHGRGMVHRRRRNTAPRP